MLDDPPTGDAAFACWLADAAGAVLLRLRAEMGHADPAALRAAGDRLSHEFIAAALARWRPADALRSEEGGAGGGGAGEDGAERGGAAADRVWIVDPLDGTREFAESGRTDWAVHIALWSAGDLAAGAVALPAQARTLGTRTPVVRRPVAGVPPRMVVSRTRAPEALVAVAARLG